MNENNNNGNNSGMVIPKSYKSITEKKFGMSYVWITVAGIAALILGLLALFVMFSGGVLRLFFIALMIIIAYLFVTKLRNDDMLEHVKLSYLYFFRMKRGDTEINKYNDRNIPILKQFLPVETIHPNGLIQYADNLYFLLIKYIPIRLSDDDRGAFLQSTVNILNSLQDGVTFKFYVVSKNTHSDTFEKQILTAATRPNASPSTKEHLYSLQKNIDEHNEGNIQWDFYIAFGLGTYTTPKEAEISRQALLTGLHDLLSTTETTIRVLELPFEITSTLYQCIHQEV